RAAEAASGIVGVGAVVIQENRVVAAIAEEGAAEFSDLRRCLHPTGRLRIELAKFLQLAILLFGEKFDAHGGRHAHGVVFGFVFFSCVQRFAVVAKASAPGGAFCGTIIKNIFARFLILTNYIRFAAGSFHFAE